MRLITLGIILISYNFLHAATPLFESAVYCTAYAKLSDNDPKPVMVKMTSYTINSNYELGRIGDETCAIAGKFRILIDPMNHGISITVADISNRSGQVDRFACKVKNNPPMSVGVPYYPPLTVSLYQKLPKELSARTISTHGFTGLQYITGNDRQSHLQLFCR